jgi:hypothetical protein
MSASKTVHLGTFDAETFWRDPGLARLPALPDPAAGRIVTAMDELLFPGCRPGDVLLTRFPMDAALANYLEQIGFVFEHNRIALDDGAMRESQASIFEIAQTAPPLLVHELLAGVSQVAPYAIIPATEAFCRKYSLPFAGPALAAVVQVNSKVYSHWLAVELGLKDYGCQVGSAAELIEEGRRYLTQGPLVIKDPFGVSGKGNLVIQSGTMVDRIGAHLAAQEKEGKNVSLVLEPFLAKKLDFSCQLCIEPDGRMHFLSLQRMYNQQLAYRGSSRLGAEQVAVLEQSGYFHKLEAVAARIYRDGYWGDLCIDSMALQDGTVVPVVEINARKSMGLINHYLDEFFSPDRLHSSLGCLSVGCPGPFHFAELLEKLEGAGLLFTQKQRRGIMPLSTNTLTINLGQPGQLGSPSGVRKGRFYFSILAAPEEREAWLEKLRCFYKASGFSVYS